jgi:hypothetical protein
MAKNFIYELICTDDRGWGAVADGLWGDLAEPEDRLFATAAEARRAMREMLDAGCWSYEDEDGIEHDDPPHLAVEKVAVHEYLWGDHDEAVTNRVIDLHGGPIEFRTMPEHVARFLLAKYSASRDAWSSESASLAGASSATHTAAFVSAGFSSRVAEIQKLLVSRGHQD